MLCSTIDSCESNSTITSIRREDTEGPTTSSEAWADRDGGSRDSFETPHKRKRSGGNTEDQIVKQMREAGEAMKNAIAAAPPVPVTVETADSIFGKLVAQSLSEIPEGYTKDVLKVDIQRMIMDAKHGQRQQSSSWFRDL